MKNILLITTIYPHFDGVNHGTPVCHFFTREWVAMGYNVRAVHLQNVFPAPFYWAAKLFRTKIAARTGAVVYTERDKGGRFNVDGVSICRIPILKAVPHGGFSARVVRKAVKEIIAYCNETEFTPDLVIGHFSNPIIDVVSQLKAKYNVPDCIVMHGDIEMTKRVYGERLPEIMSNIDCWGFRNRHDGEMFERNIAKVERKFICYSGIPAQYIAERNDRMFEGPLRKFIYVGEMIDRKYPDRVLEALGKAYPENDFELTYVGAGQRLENIRKMAEENNWTENVHCLGKIKRDDINAQYDAADCMVMISSGEAYGLVYLEAMARGCITIASRNEGFDGVIEDGVNGFLCKAGDATELAAIIQRINNMTAEERLRISNNAWQTAKGLTDRLAAERYIEDVKKLNKLNINNLSPTGGVNQ